jgi:RHS repeat-associated protein
MNFKVDGLGFRRFKEVVGQYQRWFVYDMGSSEVPGLAPLVAEYDENGNLVAKYHYDGGGLMAMTRNNQSYWYGFEGIGTVRQLMGSQGQVLDAYAFDAWGNEITSPQSQVQNPFKYFGKYGYYWDTESALMLLGMRYYSNNLGRFFALDPIRIHYHWNWYVYAMNTPSNYTDPTGQIPPQVIAGLAGCIWSGGVGAIGTYLGGGSKCDVICNGITGCILGGIGGAISVGAPWTVACVSSMVNNLLTPLICGYLCSPKCHHVPPVPSPPQNPCEVFNALVSSLFACGGSWLGEGWDEILEGGDVIGKVIEKIGDLLGLGCQSLEATIPSIRPSTKEV